MTVYGIEFSNYSRTRLSSLRLDPGRSLVDMRFSILQPEPPHYSGVYEVISASLMLTWNARRVYCSTRTQMIRKQIINLLGQGLWLPPSPPLLNPTHDAKSMHGECQSESSPSVRLGKYPHIHLVLCQACSSHILGRDSLATAPEAY